MDLWRYGVSISRLSVILPNVAPVTRSQRVTIRGGRFSNHDYLPLLQGLNHHRDCVVVVGSWDDDAKVVAKSAAVQRVLDLLLPGTELFRKSLAHKRLSQLMIMPGGYRCSLRLIYRVGFEEPWMRQLFGVNAQIEAYSKSLGLLEDSQTLAEVSSSLKVEFSVKYW